MLYDVAVARPVIIDEETFIVVRQFLMSRNDALNDDKRLAFDKNLFLLRSRAAAALREPRGLVAAAAGAVAHAVGL